MAAFAFDFNVILDFDYTVATENISYILAGKSTKSSGHLHILNCVSMLECNLATIINNGLSKAYFQAQNI